MITTLISCGIILLFGLYQRHQYRKILAAKQTDIKQLESQKRSLETIYGYAVENLTPFVDDMKDYDPKLFRQLGQPIDYIYFGEDGIEIIEVKSGNSKLSPKQKRIKKLVEDGKVVFKELRIKR